MELQTKALLELLQGPIFLTGVSCLVFALAKKLNEKVRSVIFHPVLLTIAALIVILRFFEIDYPTYRNGTTIIRFFLDVSVVALAVPLFRQLEILKKNKAAIVIGVTAGGLIGIIAAILPFMILPGKIISAISAAPSSVTTPVAMAISEKTGGIPSLTAVLVVITGILGAVIGPLILKICKVREPVAFGLAMGTAAHGIGTARALEEGDLQGATASLGLCLNALFTAAVTPMIIRWLL